MQNYFEQDAVSQSALTDLARGPMRYKVKYIDKANDEQDQRVFKIGSAVDCRLTTPDLYDDTYVVSALKMTPHIKKLAERCFDEGQALGLQFKEIDTQFALMQADIIEVLNYKRTDTRTRKLSEGKFWKYLRFLYDNPRKIVLDPIEAEKVDATVTSFLTSIFTSYLFEEEEGVEKIYQHPIFWKYRGMRAKSLLDMLFIDHNRKAIIPWDIKTTSKPHSYWLSSYYDLRYDLQGAYYTAALKWWIENIRPELKDYTIENFKFVVEYTAYPGSPLIYEMCDKGLEIGQYGGEIDKIYYRGWQQLFDDLIWHNEAGIWDYTRAQYENKGVVHINV